MFQGGTDMTASDRIVLAPEYQAESLFADCATVFTAYAEKKLGIGWTEGDNGISMTLDQSLSEEGYHLTITPDGVLIRASAKKGMHNALSDLLSRLEACDGSPTAQLADVTDRPDCPYRGLMVDLARQWHPLPYLLDYVDLCWKNRASHLQLHFTDSQSFTLPMKAYPALSTEGRFYTREEIAKLTEYADKRGITLVPEVDIPGHTWQFFEKYPEIFGKGGVLPACDEVFSAIRQIFTEVAEMFPHSPWIHIGGDEADIGAWKSCERTLTYMREHGIADIHEMYAEYIRIVTDMILSLGRTPVVWEGFSKEYDDRIDKRTIVIAWESYYQLAPELAEAGFTLINCSWKPLYIVTPDTHWTPEEIAALDPWQWDHWMQKTPAYNYGIRIDRSKPVLGEQLCAWGDRIAGWENPEEGIRLEMELVSERLPALCRKLWHLGF